MSEGGASAETAPIGQWSGAGPLGTARTRHTATVMADGRVLAVGGMDAADRATTSAEIFDPTTNSWSQAGTLAVARLRHTATRLPDGRVLVAGGLREEDTVDDNAGDLALNVAELYDPRTGTWSTTGAMAATRYDHTATLLANGKVLVAGGELFFTPSPAAEIYDPLTGTWTATGPLVTRRVEHTATLLGDGKVLVAGGQTEPDPRSSATRDIGSAEIYDPALGTWTSTGTLTTARSRHTATLLANGRVLVAGGGTTATKTSELYDPGSRTWTSTGDLAAARRAHTATLLPNGDVLVAGGSCGSTCILASAELYRSATGTWAAAAPLAEARHGHAAGLLADGRVVAAGGQASGALSSAEVYRRFVAPGAPTGVTARAGNASASVSWTAPSNDGGTPITSYTITASPGGATTTVAGSSTTATVVGLTNGVSYRFTVRATNAVGTGPASEPSNAVTPTKKRTK